jgi:pyruvate formate lyase activating enzyme
MKEASYYTVTDASKKAVQCELCPHRCKLAQGKTGICRVRKNIDGKLFTLIYNEFSSVSVDPIEKKPLYHFYPGKDILSLGTTGCNFRCTHCQNYEISQSEYGQIPLRKLTPESAVEFCKRHNSFGIAYTYNEPLIDYEWITDTANLAAENKLKNVLVTNGYINEEPLVNLLQYIDAANIDVKSFRDEFYQKICSAKIGPVLRTVEIMFKQKKHIEITYLIIPKHNDSGEEIEGLVDWISSLSPEIPLHFSRYFPHYKMSENATPLAKMERARRIALKHLRYVYLGNVWELEYNRTYCPDCSTVLVERAGYSSEIKNLLPESRCKKCNSDINIIL